MCEDEAVCSAVFNIQVVFNLQIDFINSISMIEGPSPRTIEVLREENGNPLGRAIFSCMNTHESCRTHEDGFQFSGTFPNNLSLVINSVDSEFSGTYTARATVRLPSGVDSVLQKAITGKLSLVASYYCKN